VHEQNDLAWSLRNCVQKRAGPGQQAQRCRTMRKIVRYASSRLNEGTGVFE
jgi:hypothetical protein